MADKRLKGKLSPKNESLKTRYAGHTVRLEFNGTPPETNDPSLTFRTSLTAPVENEGAYLLVVDSRVPADRTAVLEIRSPLGTRLFTDALVNLVEQDNIRAITIDPELPFVISPHPDPLKGKHAVLSGRVIDGDSTRPVFNRQVLIFAVPSGSSDEDLEIANSPVFAAVTNSNGYFSSDYPAGVFAAAVAEIDGVRTPVRLESDGTFPLRVVFVVSFPPDLPKAPKATTNGAPSPPRAPDEEDLLNSSELFTADLGVGRCVDFTKPNRTLEEVPFYKIVRTTDPDIKGTNIEAPIKVQPDFDRLIKQLAFGQGTVDSKLKVKPAGGVVGFSPAAETLLANREVIATSETDRRDIERPHSAFNVREARAAATGATRAVDRSLEKPPLVSLETNGIAAVGEWREAVETRSIDVALKEALPTLSAETLRSVLVDPDEFTPVSLMTAERLSAHQILSELVRVTRKPVAGRGPLDESNPVDWDDTPTFYQATQIAHGHILQFRQVWKADGYSLGDLLHSIPLAPCQKKQIVTIDWDRREDAARTEDLTEREFLFANLVRDRDVKEMMDTALSEEIDGGSTAKTYGGGGGLGFAIGPLVIGAGGGGSGADSTAWQNSSRQISAETMHELKDRINQSAAAVRSQRATVVQTLGQGERNRVESEVIANHNHCHALTIQYFEVLRHFQVLEELAEVRECLFVPFLMSRYHDVKVLRWREALVRNLLKRRLLPAFDAIERIQLNYLGSDLPLGMFAEEPLESLDGELRINITIARPRDPKTDETDYFEKVWPFWTRLIGGNPADVYDRFLANQQFKDRIFREQLAPQIAEKFIASLRVVLFTDDGAEVEANLDPTLASKYRVGQTHTVTVVDSGNTPAIPRKNIVAIELRTDYELPEHSQVIVESAAFLYTTRHLRHSLYDNSRVLDDLLLGDPVYLSTSRLTREEERNPRAEDQELRRKLLTHLNANLEYYHKAMWWTLDKERRFILLDGFLAPHSGGRSVASVVHNDLIGIVGNSLVFPVVAGFQLDPRYREITEQVELGKPPPTLFDLYAPIFPDPPRLLSVPTKGVFAEAVMGACNSCEKIDESRFWRWSESPCPDDPPPIVPVNVTSRVGPTPDLTATDFPAPIVNFQNIPEAPDPTGLAAALNLIGKGDVFRDITGLTQNQKNALATLQASLSTAGAFGQEAIQLAHAEAAERNIDQTLNSVLQAKADRRLTDDAARAVMKGALQNFLGQHGQQDISVVDSSAAKEAMGAALTADKSKVTVTEEKAGETQTVEVSKDGGGPGAEGTRTVVTEFDDTVTDFIDVSFVAEKLSGTKWETGKPNASVKFLKEKLLQKTLEGKYLDWFTTAANAGILQVNPADSTKYQVKAEMHICYPADPSDKTKLAKRATLAARGYPIIVLVHGYHDSWKVTGPATKNDELSNSSREVVIGKFDGQIESHKGYEDLQRELARRGFVSVSILTNLANKVDALIRMRSQIVLGSLDLLRLDAERSGSRYFRKLDFRTIGLLGHSRGGDVVIDVLKLNQDPTTRPGLDPFGISAVCGLAPSDMTGAAAKGSGRLDVAAADNVPFLVVYGSQDSDVDGVRLVNQLDKHGTGFRHYDRSTAQKAMIFINGANHNRFNTTWGNDDIGHITGTIIPAGDQRTLAQEYIGAFFSSFMSGVTTDIGLLTGESNNSLATDVAVQWQFGSAVKVVDDFEPAQVGAMHADAVVEDFAPLKPTTAKQQHICHNTKALKLPTAPGSALFFVENPGRDPEAYTELLFRLAISFEITDTTIAGTYPNFKITIKDEPGTSATVKSSDIYTQNPLGRTVPTRHKVDAAPYMTPPPTAPVEQDVTKICFETYRVPLSLFPGLQMDKLDEIRFDFDAPTTAIDVFIDSIALVKR